MRADRMRCTMSGVARRSGKALNQNPRNKKQNDRAAIAPSGHFWKSLFESDAHSVEYWNSGIAFS
jgi:hypothetical protein